MFLRQLHIVDPLSITLNVIRVKVDFRAILGPFGPLGANKKFVTLKWLVGVSVKRESFSLLLEPQGPQSTFDSRNPCQKSQPMQIN